VEVSGKLHTPAASSSCPSPLYSLDRGLVGPQSRYVRRREKKHLLPLTGIKTQFFSCPTRGLVSVQTEISRFHSFDLALLNHIVSSATTCSRWFLARGLFYPEDGGDTFLRNVGSHKIYTAPHPRSRNSS
jgi:hypothetical protein